MLALGRQIGWSAGPIPPSEILSYQQHFRPHLTLDASWIYLTVIARLDSLTLQLREERRKK